LGHFSWACKKGDSAWGMETEVGIPKGKQIFPLNYEAFIQKIFRRLKEMTDLYFDGELFIYPILFVSVVGMAITIERLFHLNRVRSVNRKMRDVLHPMLDKSATTIRRR
jgi:hypothetical protein